MGTAENQPGMLDKIVILCNILWGEGKVLLIPVR